MTKARYLLNFLIGFITMILVIFPTLLRSQSFIFNNLDTDDGLLSSEVYDILQDSLGNIWFATEAGISIYDGYEFKSLSSIKGLPDNSILKLFLSPEGNIWFSTYSGNLGIFDKDKQITLIDEQVSNYLPRNFIYLLQFRKDKSKWMTTLKGITFMLSDNKMEIVEKRPLSLYRTLKVINDDSSLNCFLSPSIEPIEESRFDVSFESDTLLIHYANRDTRFFFDYCMIDSNKYFLSFNEQLYYINENHLEWRKEFSVNELIIDIYFDGQKYLFVSLESKGVEVYDVTDPDNPMFKLFDELTISKIFKDRDGTYWFTSLGEGVYTLPSMDYNILKPTFQKKIISYELLNNTIWYYQHMKGLSSYNMTNKSELIKKYEFTDSPRLAPVYSILTFNDTILVLSGLKNSFFNTELNPFDKVSLRFAATMSIISDTNIIEAGVDFYRILDSDLKTVYESPDTFSANIKATCEDNEGNIWLGTTNGLFLHKDSTTVNMFKSNPIFGNRVSCIERFNSGIVIGTTTNGIIIYNDDTLINISESDDLASNYIKSLMVDSNTIWIGTNKGLSKLILKENPDSNFTLENYTLKFGLPAREIFEISKEDSLIYIATENGIIYFDPTKVEAKGRNPDTFLENIIINNYKVDIDSIISLSSDQDNITLNYKAISFQNNKDLRYQYILSGYDDNWISTKNISIRYTDLPPGFYTFKIKATIDGINYGSTASINIFKEKHFTETLIFRIILAIIFLSIILFILQLIIKNNRRKEQRERNRIEAEQKALRLQMNPHFIYNSLGSIQRFILEQDTYVANEYLTDFASLMRLILESSKSSLVPINDEITAYELYLRLENLRFNNGIISNITISNDLIQENIKIPPLLIQPLIENAIWHGVMHNGGIGQLDILFTKHSQDLLLCEIIDNGIGFEQSKLISKANKNHKSTGLKNIYDRISLLSDIYNVDMKMEILDLKNNSNNSTGTKVNLYLYYLDESI